MASAMSPKHPFEQKFGPMLSKHLVSSYSVFCTQAAIEMFLYILDIEDGLKGFERVQTNWSWNKSNNASFDKQ